MYKCKLLYLNKKKNRFYKFVIHYNIVHHHVHVVCGFDQLRQYSNISFASLRLFLGHVSFVSHENETPIKAVKEKKIETATPMKFEI